MADQVKVKLLRPLAGVGEIGDQASYSKADADRLASTGAVAIVKASTPRKPAAKKAK